MKRSIIILSGLTILLGDLLAGCGQQKQTAQKQKITLMQTTELTSLDSTNQATLPEFNTLTNTTEGLYRLDKNDQPVPAMATKIVKPTANGTQYLFKIRRNAKWSNGDPVTASDFEYAWKRAMNPANNPVYTYIFSGIKNADAINAGKKSYQTLGIKALNKRTLQITLDHPMPYFNKLVTVPVFLPQDESFVKQVGVKKYGSSAKTTVSNGAFKVSHWNGTNDSYRLVRNNYYWDKKTIHLKQINYLTVKDSNTAHNLFASNKLDDATITGVTAKELQNNADLKHVAKAWTYYLQVNQKNGAPLANQKLRQAISLVIDRKTLTKNVLADGSQPATSFVSPGTATDPTTGKDFSREISTTLATNTKKAKQLWQAGLAESNQSNQTVQLSIIGDDQDVTKNVSQYLQQQIEQKLPNVKVSIKNVPDEALHSLKADNKFALSQWYWLADFSDPINYLGVLKTNNSLNSGHYSDTQFDQLMDKTNSAAVNNQGVYWQTLRQAEARIQQTSAIIPLYYVRESHLVNPKLHGVLYHQAGEHDYTRAYLK